MAKANFALPNGTVVNVEGSPEEIERLLSLYSGSGNPPRTDSGPKKSAGQPGAQHTEEAAPEGAGAMADLVAIVNTIRTCERAGRIESIILDNPNRLNRVLLPLFIVHEYMGNTAALTSGEIHKITKDLGIPISIGNVSTTLSVAAKGLVVGDKMRVKGHAVRYKLSRRGVQHMEDLLRAA